MEDHNNMIESLLERATEYGRTSFELIKLKALDRTADVVSTCVTHSVVIVFFLSFMLFLNLGLALWIGEISGKIYYGFFVVAGLYAIGGVFIHLVMHKWIKKLVYNNFIKQVLK
jgi:hypothetical protein